MRPHRPARFSVLALGALAAFAVGCASNPTSTMRVKTNSAVVSTVAEHRTYSHETAEQAPAGYAETALTPEVLEKVRQQIDVEMEKKGYQRVPVGDLVVRISAGVRAGLEEPTGTAAVQGAPVTRDRIGSLVIDVFDRENQGHLFHGYARDQIHGDGPKDTQIDEAVKKILEPLPARTPTL